MKIWDDFSRFWSDAWKRGAIYCVAFSAVLALVAFNWQIFYGSYLQSPPGIGVSNQQFLTLGQVTPEGIFAPVADRDLDRLGLQETDLIRYGTATSDVVFHGKKHNSRSVGLVSPNFFLALRVNVYIGGRSPLGPRDVVISDSLWKLIGRPSSVIGKTLLIGGEVFTVIGVAAPEFRGIAGAGQSVWISKDSAALINNISLPLPPAKILQFREALATELPIYFGLLKTSKANATLRPSPWKVRDSNAIRVEVAGQKLILGLDATLHRAKVLDGIVTNPSRRAQLRKFNAILALLNFVALLLAMLSLGLFLASRTAKRSNEYALRKSLGATSWDLAIQASNEIIPLFVFAIFLAFPLYLVISIVLYSVEPFSSVGVAARGLSVAGVAPSLGATLLPYIVTIGVQVWSRSLVQKPIRGMGLSPPQKKFSRLLQTSYWTICAVVIVILSYSLSTVFILNGLRWGGQRDPTIVTLNEVDEVQDIEKLLAPLSGSAGVMQTPPLGVLQMRRDGQIHPSQGACSTKVQFFTNRVQRSAISLLGLKFIDGKNFDDGGYEQVLISESLQQAIIDKCGPLGDGSRLIINDPLNASGDASYRIEGVVGNVRFNDIEAPPPNVVYLYGDEFLEGDSVVMTESSLRAVRRELDESINFNITRSFSLAKSMSAIWAQRLQSQLTLTKVSLVYTLICALVLAVGLVSEARTKILIDRSQIALRYAVGETILGARLKYAASEARWIAVVLLISIVAGWWAAEKFGLYTPGAWFVILSSIFCGAFCIASYAILLIIYINREFLHASPYEMLKVE